MSLTRFANGFRFYDWNAATGGVRWMTAFDTAQHDVDEFADAFATALTSR